MKGSKEGKGDGGKAAGPALFPRLHVTETKKAGPRGPPRNKMALYEQLTIPSRRFKPTPVPLPSSGRAMNGSMTTPIYQPQVQSPASSFDSRYSYMPVSYMSPIIPTMAYMPMMNVGMYGVGNGSGSGSGGGASATSSMNASSVRSTVVDATTESQRVPRSEEAVSRRQNSSGHSSPSAASKDGKEDDDFAVPTYSATQASSHTRASGSPLQVQQALRGGRGRGAQKGKELAIEKRCGGLDEVRRMRKERSMEDDASWTSASVECATVSMVDDDVNPQELKNRKADGGRRDCDGHTAELCVSHIGQERTKEQKEKEKEKVEKEKGLSNHSNTTSSGGAGPEVIDSPRPVPEQDALSGQNQSGEVSEPSQPRGGSSTETELSMLENMTSGSICFRDVVDAFGQQEFWKAQSTIIRQQKLFARQVFELHRVIEVQQLLAKKSSLSLNIDEVLVEEEADNVPVSVSPVADVPVVPEISEVDGSQSSDENSRPVPEAVCQPIYPLSVPTQQDFNAGSAWQAAPFGANPWAARMASPFMYVPFSGPYPPGYGVYPTMGAPMPMCGGSGGVQGARFPAWQQPGMSQPWRIQESAAAAAACWYGQQPVVPTVGAPTVGVPTASMGGAWNSERPTSSAVNKSNGWEGFSGRQCGEKGNGGANGLSEADGGKNCGWAKGWGNTEERVVVRGDAETSLKSKECVGGPSVGYELGRREGDGGCETSKPRENGDAALAEQRKEHEGSAWGCGRERVESESDRSWPSGASYEGPLQNRTLKRPRTEFPEAVVSPWFRIMSPNSNRITQQNGVIKVVPRAVSATPESAASILLSIQKERQR